MVEVEFIFNGIKTIIQCNINEKMKDICNRYINKIGKDIKKLNFIYDGNNLNENILELSFNENANNIDKERKKMNILVYEINSKYDIDKIKKSKEIICPKCKENIRIEIKNYKIRLYECKNGHNIENIILNEFENSQYIDESKIICNKCKENNKLNTNIFYRCNKCKINICPICKLKHNELHNIINYEIKNYICEKHNEIYISYCNKCKKNICMICINEHDNHEIIYYNKIISDKEKKIEELKELRNKIDKMNEDIDKIINKLKIIKENIEIYYNICNNIIKNYNIKNRNK